MCNPPLSILSYNSGYVSSFDICFWILFVSLCPCMWWSWSRVSDSTKPSFCECLFAVLSSCTMTCESIIDSSLADTTSWSRNSAHSFMDSYVLICCERPEGTIILWKFSWGESIPKKKRTKLAQLQADRPEARLFQKEYLLEENSVIVDYEEWPFKQILDNCWFPRMPKVNWKALEFIFNKLTRSYSLFILS